MPLLLAVAFVAGLLTILSPCILPIIPIVLSTSATGGARRSWGVGVGLVLSFTFSSALLASVVLATGVPAEPLRMAAIVGFFVLGVVLLIPSLRHRVELTLERVRGMLPVGSSGRSGNGFLGGLPIGLGIGLLCTPCAGPILTAVATLGATSHVSAGVVAVAAAYAAGLAVPLTALGMGGRAAVHSLRGVARVAPTLAGVLLIGTALALAFGVDERAQLWAAQATNWTGSLQAIEQQPAVAEALAKLEGTTATTTQLPSLQNFGPAPNFVGLTDWINSAPLQLSALRGKVVLIDFWTYSCVNCVRELPHIEAWYQRYKADGLVVIGVHSPEFAFEHDPANVARAVRAQGITFPVALDNRLETWTAFANRAWPELYLIDATGAIKYIHLGEGDYPATEGAIRTLLTQAGNPPSGGLASLPDRSPTNYAITPEMYLGADKLHTLGSLENASVDQPIRYSVPKQLSLGSVAFDGVWTLRAQAVQADGPGALVLHFYAAHVYVVLDPTVPAQVLDVSLDGAPIPNALAGRDVKDGRLTLGGPRLYALVNLHGPAADHTLTLRTSAAGLLAYSFTFG